MMPILRIENVAHAYSGKQALNDISFELAEGELTGIIGPDGVGKSTLLGLVTGAKRLQAGRIELFGGSMAEARHRRLAGPRIAFMPQGLGTNLYADLSLEENLEFFGRLFGLDSAQRRQRINVLLAATDLAPFANRLAGKLSGGMKQKLGLCCALIHDPDILVLDEPTTGVDPLSRLQFWALVDAIRGQNRDLSIIVATSYMAEAEAFDRLIAMDTGRILKIGTPTKLIADAGVKRLDDAYRVLSTQEPVSKTLVVPPRQAAASAPVIVASELTKKFGDFTAVDSVSFAIEQGEIFGFLGSNGCGKSTTMKMLTGLLPASAGKAELFGHLIDANNRQTRHDIGYMSQGFSLYSELTVRQNLDLHARLFELGSGQRRKRIDELCERFGLMADLDNHAAALPLGLRQRLSLAVAVIHQPRILILDEPTSGVDPAARDAFWRLIVELSRDDGVTIFVSTHFMREAEWCDRVSLMHAGRVLTSDTPQSLIDKAGVSTLEEAFIHHLRTGNEHASSLPTASIKIERQTGRRRTGLFSLTRFLAYALRESVEVLRDRVRLGFAFFGSALLMVFFCYGISLDVDDLKFAVLDQAKGPESRAYLATLEGSGYFAQQRPLANVAEGRQRLVDGEISLTIELPSDFGRNLRTQSPTSVLAAVDGALPFMGETIEGYMHGIHAAFLAGYARETSSDSAALIRIEPRFRYNQSFESIAALAPAMPAILLVLLPAILTAVSVARERELGSITNFYVTPTTRFEFLFGKQAPYLAIAFVNFLLLAAMIVWVFGVPLKGSVFAMVLGALLYVWATTSFGLVVSALTSSQVAAVFATAISSIIPTIQFSGLLQPVSTLDGGARLLGSLWPASYFLNLSVGAFTKALGFQSLLPDLLALAVFGPVFTLIAVLTLKAQEA